MTIQDVLQLNRKGLIKQVRF